MNEMSSHINHGTDHKSFIVGRSRAILNVFREISKVAKTSSTVLITGETGTGKELVAKAIHEQSYRSEAKLVRVNCAALPSQLLESELFGFEKGAFTGAHARRIGKFELADGGTIFLDEIGELSMELQAKILRVIQEKEFERIGGNDLIKSDVRIISATNKDLNEEVEKGRFRKDLFYRLNVYPIDIPPLRARREDIPLLTGYFLKNKALGVSKEIPGPTDNQIEMLLEYSWPGNVRQLEHVIERAVISSDFKEFRLILPEENADPNRREVFIPQTYREAEFKLILETLKYCSGKVRGAKGAAKVLGLPPTTLESKMKKLGITRRMIS